MAVSIPYTPESIKESNYYKVAKQYDNIPLAEEVKQKIITNYYDNIYQYDYNNNTDYGSIYLDVYAIGRILRTIFSYNDNKIIIVYVGDRHIKNFISILTEIYNAQKLFKSETIKTIEELVEYNKTKLSILNQPKYKYMFDHNLNPNDKRIIIDVLQSIL